METVAFTAQRPSQPETSDIDVKLKNMRGYFNSEGQCALVDFEPLGDTANSVIKLLILEDYKIYVSRVLGVIVLNYKLPVEARLAIFIDFKECLKFLLVIKLTEDVP